MTFSMTFLLIKSIQATVADTYLSYTSNIDGAEAFKRFVSKKSPLVDVKRDPKFSTFTDEELIDEMVLLAQDIARIVAASN